MPPTKDNLQTPENPAPESQNKFAWKSLLKEILIFILIAFGIILPFRVYVAEPYIVDGASMEPTFKTGNYLI
jgi:signal peptidase I